MKEARSKGAKLFYVPALQSNMLVCLDSATLTKERIGDIGYYLSLM